MSQSVSVLIDTPRLCVLSEDGIETAVWEPGTSPAEHGCVLLSKPSLIERGLMSAEVMTAETVADLRELAETFSQGRHRVEGIEVE